MLVLNLNENLPTWTGVDGTDDNVVGLDACREPSASVLITQRGCQWYWTAQQDSGHNSGVANTYEGAAAAAGDWMKGRVN